MTTEEQVLQILELAQIDMLLTLPCDRMKSFLKMIPEDKEIPLTREAGGVGIAAGAYMAGKKPAMIIQNTGLGNMLINLVSLTVNYQFPLPILVSWRGVEGETIDAQRPFGEKTPDLLKTFGIKYYEVSSKDDISLIKKTVAEAYEESCPVVALIKPTFWDNPAYEPPTPKRDASDDLMNRYDAMEVIVKAVAEQDSEGLVISNIGFPSKEAYALDEKYRDHDHTFYMLGSLGEATTIGLGVAIASKKHVYVLDGDGSVLHNPNMLDAMKTMNPDNLTVFCLDNAVYSSTGDQITASYHIDLEKVAQGYGIKNTVKVQTKEALHSLIGKSSVGSLFAHVMLKSGNVKSPNVGLNCLEIKKKFMKNT